MLFNSYEFMFLFLPLGVVGFFVVAQFFSLNTAPGFLVFAALAFFACRNPAYLLILPFSIIFNFAIGQALCRDNFSRKMSVLILGIGANPAALIALVLQNAAQIFHSRDPVLYENDTAFRGNRSSRIMAWSCNNGRAVSTALAGLAGILTLQQESEFLYFEF